MSDFKPIQFDGETLRQYWEGPGNVFVRYFSYFQRGVSLANEVKYLVALFGIGLFTSDFQIPGWLMVVAGLVAIPILTLIGRWHMFKAQKALEFITVQHGSVTKYQGYNMQCRQVEQNDEIIRQNNEILGFLKAIAEK